MRPSEPPPARERLTRLAVHAGDRGEHVAPQQLAHDPAGFDPLAQLVVDPDPRHAVRHERGSHAVGQHDALAQERARCGRDDDVARERGARGDGVGRRETHEDAGPSHETTPWRQLCEQPGSIARACA